MIDHGPAKAAETPLSAALGPPPEGWAAALAPSGVLRAGINLSNFLLASARQADGAPAGVAPDMAKALAGWLGLPLALVPYENPGKLADAAAEDQWDVALLGAEPQRAQTIAFTSAYCQIDATAIVREGSPLRDCAEIDRAGLTIACAPRTAWGLWLDRNIHRATLIKADGYDAAKARFLAEGLDVLAGLRPKLMEDLSTLPGMRPLAGRFMAVRQAIGLPRAKGVAVEPLDAFARAAVECGFVAALIAGHGVAGLTVADGAA